MLLKLHAAKGPRTDMWAKSCFSSGYSQVFSYRNFTYQEDYSCCLDNIALLELNSWSSKTRTSHISSRVSASFSAKHGARLFSVILIPKLHVPARLFLLSWQYSLFELNSRSSRKRTWHILLLTIFPQASCKTWDVVFTPKKAEQSYLILSCKMNILVVFLVTLFLSNVPAICGWTIDVEFFSSSPAPDCCVAGQLTERKKKIISERGH